MCLAMDEDLRNRQELQDGIWRSVLSLGREELGSPQINLDLLRQTGLIEYVHKILEIVCGVGRLVFELDKERYGIAV